MTNKNNIFSLIFDMSINGFQIVSSNANKNNVNNVISNYESYLNKKNNQITMDLNNLVEDFKPKKKKMSKREKINTEYYNYFISTVDRHQIIEDNKNYNISAQKTFVNDKPYTSKKEIVNISKHIDLMYDEFYKDIFIDNNNKNKTENKIENKIENKKQSILCNNLSNKKQINKKKLVEIDIEINSIKDLIELINKYPIKNDVEYNVNIQPIHNIKEPLIKLDNMIGMKNLKEDIVDQILYYTQELHSLNKTNEDFMHTVIYGPPGTGKTEIAKIIGDIFSKLGILKKNTFKKATRSDFVAGYLGQTALKTQELIKSCLGGVLFIDEAYALGNEEKRDSFAKECIDTLCEALSDHKDELMVIVAGYEKELKHCFFDYNQGLESRFSWTFNTDDYDAEQLKQIFIKKMKEAKWSLKNDNVLDVKWFEKNKKYFKYYGRDIETLFSKTKICHSRRIFCKPKENRTKITKEDLENGFKLFCKNEEVKKRGEEINNESLEKMFL